MKVKENNYAFIDSQNLNLSIRELGWSLNFKHFYIYLKEKYNDLYKSLQEAGFICIFKPTLKHKDGTTKGNCDAELVLQAMIEYSNYENAVIVTGDGDFYCLVKYLIEKNKLKAIIIPNRLKFSALLKFKICRPYLRFLNDLSKKLGYRKEKTP